MGRGALPRTISELNMFRLRELAADRGFMIMVIRSGYRRLVTESIGGLRVVALPRDRGGKAIPRDVLQGVG